MGNIAVAKYLAFVIFWLLNSFTTILFRTSINNLFSILINRVRNSAAAPNGMHGTK